jgi:hypothetical protein
MVGMLVSPRISSADEIPFCTLEQLLAPGAENATEAAQESQEAAGSNVIECRVNPADVIEADAPPWYDTPPALPRHPSTTGFYHWQGASTNGSTGGFEGVQATLKVVNINDMPHDGNLQQFVAGRVMLVRDDLAHNCPGQQPGSEWTDFKWAEVGWVEVDWKGTNSDQYFYTYDTVDCVWKFYGKANSGQTYIFRARENAGNLRLERWGGSGWILLDSLGAPDCSTDACRAENFLEVYTQGTHPSFASAIPHTLAKLDTAGLNWPDWNAGFGSDWVETSPYHACNRVDFTSFTAKDTAC